MVLRGRCRWSALFWKEGGEDEIEDTIKNGKEMMPAFTLEPDQIKAIIQYMSHTFRKTTRENGGGRKEK